MRHENKQPSVGASPRTTVRHTSRHSKFQGHSETDVFWATGMAAIIAQTLRPHVGRSGGDLAVHDAGLRALASSWVPDLRVRRSRLRRDASDGDWCTVDVVQARQSIQGPSFGQIVVLFFTFPYS